MTALRQGPGRWPLVTIMGPTAMGKSTLALALAARLPVDLISVDSASVYRGLDIGSAKPDPALRERWRHALIDIRDPGDPYTAGDFRRDALAAIEGARSAGRVPVLVGGTMLYFRVLEQGIAQMPNTDPAVRARFAERLRCEGLAPLQAELARIDPAAAARIDARNPQRVLRALEVHAVSGRPISSFWAEQAGAAADLEAFTPLRIGLLPDDRARLHSVIAERFDAMLEQGLVAEVRALRARGDLHGSLPALRAVGYRQVWAHLDGEYGFADMRDKALAATRQLARRQLTWLRGWPGLEARMVAPGAAPDAAAVAGLVDRVESALATATA